MATQAEVEKEEVVRQLIYELNDIVMDLPDNILVVGVQAMIDELIAMSERGEYHQLCLVVQAFLLGHAQALNGNQEECYGLIQKIKAIKIRL